MKMDNDYLRIPNRFFNLQSERRYQYFRLHHERFIHSLPDIITESLFPINIAYSTEIVYTVTADCHEIKRRFRQIVQKWFNHRIEIWKINHETRAATRIYHIPIISLKKKDINLLLKNIDFLMSN